MMNNDQLHLLPRIKSVKSLTIGLNIENAYFPSEEIIQIYSQENIQNLYIF